MIENPNRKEANQLAILQAQWRIWTNNYQEKIQLAGLELQITSPASFLHHAHIICFTL